MIITTTPGIDGKTITRYCGVVTGEAILGANLFRDFFASVRDIVGGRSASYEKQLHTARQLAFKELEEEAEKSALTRSSGSTSTTKWSDRVGAC